jgi:hypothetical protein
VGVERVVATVGPYGLRLVAVGATLCMTAACSDVPDDTSAADAGSSTRLIQLWSADTPAFGVFVPNERPGGEVAPDGSRLPPLYTSEGGASLGENPLLTTSF